MNLTHYAGLRIVSSPMMFNAIEDWSGCRSRARAERRRRLGHPQRVRVINVPKQEFFQIGDTLYAHPDMVAKLEEAVRK